MLKKFRSSLTAQVMAGTLVSFLLLGCVMAWIGNREVTEAVEEQYVDAAYRTAVTALIFLDPEKLADYVAMDDTRWAEETRTLADRWNRIAENQDCMLIYAVPVEPGYESIRSAERVNVALSVRSFEAGGVSPKLRKAWRGDISIRGNRRAYLDILERGQQRAVIIRPQTSVLGPHLTLMVPIKTPGGEIRGVLSVQREMDKLVAAQRSHVFDVILGAVVLLAVILPLRAWGLRRGVLKPIQAITRETLRFAREDTLPAVPLGADVPFSNEIGQLARSIDAMEAENLEHVANLVRVTAEKEQIQAELGVARKIQASMLPRDFVLPGHPELSLFATMDAAKEVGGDFYDFFLIDADHLALVMADVSGKGVPAALFMVVARTLIRNRAQMGGTPAEILGDVNDRLCDGNDECFFVTVWLGILEISTGRGVAANAGHEYPALKRAGGAWELVRSKHSTVVAARKGMKFHDVEFELRPDDSLYLYTDGVPEATRIVGFPAANSNQELFGLERMTEALNRHESEAPEELLASMKREIDAFVGDAPQFDDITMLCLRYHN
ncbi:MAG: SpoIIE family protein phosphatase [Fretibacterium sp.]|nr:SpoIIE family protein phosphatase [Fretibacterium sp.]